MTSPTRYSALSVREDSDSSSSAANSRPSTTRPQNAWNSRASAAAVAAATSHFYTHPSRISILDEFRIPSANDSPVLVGGQAAEDTTRMEDGSHREPQLIPQLPDLQSFSRAFDRFTSKENADILAEDSDHDRFFVPSYLEGSTYVQLLKDLHKVKIQSRHDQGRDSKNGAKESSATSLPQGAHLGMSHTVRERSTSSADDSQFVTPLPSRWNLDESWGGIEVSEDGLGVKYVGSRSHSEREHEAYGVRANHHMPPQCGLYYFEVEIVSAKHNDATIVVGFSTKTASLTRPVGWEPESWGYHGDDGQCMTAQCVGKSFAQPYGKGDIIGCGVNFKDNTAFFTKNGARILGTDPFANVVRGKLYPTISLKKSSEEIRVNFGQSPFVYDINHFMKLQMETVQSRIDLTDTSHLEPGMNETELIQSLVLQFLQHDGYVETARAFAQDIHAEKESLNMDPDTQVPGINIKDDEDANNRQRIRRAVLEGDIDRALKFTNAYYPQVLPENEQVHFRLRCRRFIEMVRKAALLNMELGSSGSNGAQDMDVDLDGDHDATGDDGKLHDQYRELEASMLDYGKVLQSEYAGDPRKEVTQALENIWTLLGYSNPLKEPTVAHLLDRQGRVAVAEELNSAILLSLGKSSRAALEKLYAQTTVLLEDLRQDGSDAAFVSVKELVDEIPGSREP